MESLGSNCTKLQNEDVGGKLAQLGAGEGLHDGASFKIRLVFGDEDVRQIIIMLAPMATSVRWRRLRTSLHWICMWLRAICGEWSSQIR